MLKLLFEQPRLMPRGVGSPDVCHRLPPFWYITFGVPDAWHGYWPGSQETLWRFGPKAREPIGLFRKSTLSWGQ